MKKLKLAMILLALSGLMQTAYGQHVVKVYPKHGTVVHTVYKPRVVAHRGATYHFSEGIWYTRTGPNYVVCAAPRGIRVRRLPRGRIIVHVNGRKLYRCMGVLYEKEGRYYIVVDA